MTLIAVILEILVFVFAKDLILYGEQTDEVIDYSLGVELQNFSNATDQNDGK